MLQIVETPRKQSRANEQHSGQDNLRNNQPLAEAHLPDAAGEPLELALDGEFGRGSVLRARVRAEVDLARIPLFGSIGTVEVSGDAAAPVDRYRSLLGEAPPP